MLTPDEVSFDPGSFKDPDGGVLFHGNRVFRYFTDTGATSFRAVTASGLLDVLARKGIVVESRPVDMSQVPGLSQAAPDAALFVEHPRIPFVSYCYEWPFGMLKAAALCHLDIVSTALEQGYILKDATPYNVQFLGTRPLFVDVASFEPYVEGQPWNAYSQFCHLFLNPLLLQALTGVRFQDWLRGALDGISPGDLSRTLSWRHKLRPAVFAHVALHAWLEEQARSAPDKESMPRKAVGKHQLVRMVTQIRKTIAGLRPGRSPSIWTGYEEDNTYSRNARARKDTFVESALAVSTPRTVWDLGCNTGRYALLASRHAAHVVAMDGDPDAVDALYERASASAPNVLPLVVNLLDPSPDRGWAQAERRGILQRGPADMALCLALVHHLSIGGNVPLPRVAAWLRRTARRVIVEFVPKEDAGAQKLLRWKQDVYPGYTQAAFEAALHEHFQISDQCRLPDSGRILYSLT